MSSVLGQCGVDDYQRDLHWRIDGRRGEKVWRETGRGKIIPQRKFKERDMGEVTNEHVNLRLRFYVSAVNIAEFRGQLSFC